MARPTKQFKRFASSGKLTETIKNRRVHREKKAKFDEKVEQRKRQRGAPRPEHEVSDGEDDEDGSDEDTGSKVRGGKVGGVARTVDELFGAGGLDVPIEEGSDLEDLSEDDGEAEDEEGDEDMDGDDEEMDEEAMARAMAALEKKDPEFFKHLKAEDPSLLHFGKGGDMVDDVDEDEEGVSDDEEMMDEDEDESAPAKIVVTKKMLRGWRMAMIQQHSIRSLRKMLIAFRAAAHMNEDEGEQGTGLDTKYTIPSAEVFNKLVITALKFTPVVLAAHVPFKTLPNGRIKLQAPKKSAPANFDRMVLSHFSTLLHLIKSLPSTPSALSGEDDDSEAGSLLTMAVSESAKLLPWVLGARKHLRAYLKVLLDLWSSASDSVRVAAFLAIRKMFVSGDEAIKDVCLRNIYRALLPPMRSTSVHTLPALNLMKNTASELYQLEPSLSYQHAFTFIRMLAVHIRNVVRSTTSGKGGEDGQAFKAVYNWAYVHSIDFWSQVLAGAASVEAQRACGGLESPLKPLIYPLTQIALGMVRLLPSSRYFPLRFHVLSSLIRLVALTGTYIPLAPYLLEILDSAEFRRANPKKATLKPLDLAYVIRAPAAYAKTRVFQETLGEELVFLLGDYHAQLATNIAFPEIVLPVIMAIKRHIKRGSAGAPKVANQLKVLADKLDAQRTWVESKRRNVSFAPRDRSEVARFADGVKVESTPLGAWMRIQRKTREQRRREVEKALREVRESSDDEE